MKRENRRSIAFAPWMVAGVRTQWENMRPYIPDGPELLAHVVEINPHKDGGLVERIPLLPSKVKGNVRALVASTGLFHLPPLDAAWIPDLRSALPFLLTKGSVDRAMILSSTDATGIQMAEFSGLYDQSANTSLAGRLRNALDVFCHSRATLLCPWSDWAARSFINDYGVSPDKIRILPPGIDLTRWPMLERPREGDDISRLLFVGADFHRKGGNLLLEVFDQQFRGRCELHLVTREEVTPRPGVFVYRDFSPNDPGLRRLYEQCDIFVLPTRADCFSLASLEAMATGLPVITTRVGGIPEIVADGRSGFLIAPDDGRALATCLETVLTSAGLRTRMGREGREIVEDRFNAARNTANLVDLMTDRSHVRGDRRASMYQCP